MPKRSLKDIAKDMRTMGQLLIEGAEELDKVAGVDFSALATLLGGGSAETGPFEQSESTSERPVHRRRKSHRHLTKEQKQQVRERWHRLPPNAQTPEMRKQLAEQYGVSAITISAIISNNMAKARAARQQRMAPVSKSNSMAS